MSHLSNAHLMEEKRNTMQNAWKTLPWEGVEEAPPPAHFMLHLLGCQIHPELLMA